MNAERKARGLKPLRWSAGLSRYAYAWSRHMGTKKALVHSNIGSLLKTYDYVGENIAMGSKGVSGSTLHSQWMHSQGHRDDLLSPGFTQAAVGVFCAPDGSVWATTDFGRPWGQGQPPPYKGGTPAKPFARPDKDNVKC